MRKIMIIDDEMLVREGLKSCIEWEKHGYTIVAMAKNALEGLALMKSVKPDIVITDICMPEMDGLAFIERAKARFPATKIIVLSCYSELEYVKLAIKLGAEDYILKLSIEPEKLLELIMRLDKEPCRTGAGVLEKPKQMGIGDESLLVLREDLLRRFLAGELAEEDFVRHIREMCPRWPIEQPVLIYGGIVHDGNAFGKSETCAKSPKCSCVNILEELMQGPGGGIAFEWQERCFLLAIAAKDVQNVIDFCHCANRIISQCLDVSLSWGISSAGSAKSIRSLFQECMEAYAHCFYFRNESIVAYDDTATRPFAAANIDIGEILPEIADAGTRDYAQRMREILDMFVKTNVHPERVKKTMLRVAYELAAAGRAKAAKAGLDWQPKEDPFDCLPNVDTIWQIQDYFQRTLSDLDASLSAGGIGERPEIYRVKTYVEQHIQEDITLDQVARYCGMSRSYFSSLFKRETGEGLNDYINRRKMERAKELMLHRRLKAYEAAYAVGLSDESYFSKLFKKHIGISPKELKANEFTEK